MFFPVLIVVASIVVGFALVGLASILAVALFFLFASIAQLISITRENLGNHKIRLSKEPPNVEVRDSWNQESGQNITSRSISEQKGRRAS